MAKTNTSLKIHGKVQTSFTETDSSVASGAPPGSVFGPVKKFRPVVCRSVEKETSLHGSLMEAIQTGRGRDGLRKVGRIRFGGWIHGWMDGKQNIVCVFFFCQINTPGPSGTKKALPAEEENERSALLAAIRAQSSCGRLRKVKRPRSHPCDSMHPCMLEF